MVLALGATAARALAGRAVRVPTERGRPLGSIGGATFGVTIHPSAILRMPDAASRHEAMDRLVADLEAAAGWKGRRRRPATPQSSRDR